MWVFLGIIPPKRGGLERSPLQPHLLPGQVNRHLIDFLAVSPANATTRPEMIVASPMDSGILSGSI